MSIFNGCVAWCVVFTGQICVSYLSLSCSSGVERGRLSHADVVRYEAAMMGDSEAPNLYGAVSEISVGISDGGGDIFAGSLLSRDFEVSRLEYEVFFEQSPGRLLSRMILSPFREGGELVGYRIDRFVEPFSGVDLLEGDVIVSVDGALLRNPDAFYSKWMSLRGADGCSVSVRRGGVIFDVRWRVVP